MANLGGFKRCDLKEKGKKWLGDQLTPSVESRTFVNRKGKTAKRQTSCKNSLLVHLSRVLFSLDQLQSRSLFATSRVSTVFNTNLIFSLFLICFT